MGLLNDYSGVGMSPRPKWRHQMVMSQLLANMYFELIPKGYVPLTEATVTDNWNDLAPDIVVFDQNNVPMMIVEITTHKECYEILQKCEELMERFPYAEYFVYDYESEVLFGFDDASQEWFTSLDAEICSRFLKRPLLEYLN